MIPDIKLLGSYGLDQNSEYQVMGTGLRILKHVQEPVDFDLLEGFQGDNERSHDDHANRNKIDNTLTWMIDHFDDVKSECEDKLFNVDFICGNGLFYWILASPYETEKNRQIAATMFKGNIYLQRVGVEDICKTDERASYAGNKFLELVTEKLDPSDAGHLYYNVIKAKLEGHSLIHASQVHCIKNGCEVPLKIDDFVKVKTAKNRKMWNKNRPSRTSNLFRRTESRQWWSQLVMTGIKDVIIGIKSDDPDDLICRTIHRMTIDDMLHGIYKWSPTDSMSALDKFLTVVKETVTEDDVNCVHLFTIKGLEIDHELIIKNETVLRFGEFRFLTKEMEDKINSIYNFRAIY